MMKASFLGFVLLAASLVAAETPSKFGRLPAGSFAADFTAVGVDGKELKLSELKGKTVILNFWATNRGPAEPLQGAYLNYQDMGVVVLAICSGAARGEFDKWVEKAKGSVGYVLAWDPAGGDRAASISQKNFGLGVYPATGVIDREGKVVGGFVGFGSQTPALLRGLLRDAGLAIPPEEVPKPAAARSPPPEDTALKPGTVAPDFTALDPSGHPVKLSDFAGKIVVLDFWATWCGPCIESMPHSEQIAAATKTMDVVVLAACTSDTQANFGEWLGKNGAKYPDLVFANDPNGRDASPEKYAERVSNKLYGVRGIPTQFVIGRDGKIVEVIIGYGHGDTRLEQALKQLGVKVPDGK